MKVKYLLLFFLLNAVANAQAIHKFKFKNVEYEYLSYSNDNGSKIPGYNIDVIIGGDTENINEIFEKDTLKNAKSIHHLDKTFFYYLKANKFCDDQNIYEFLKAFIHYNHEIDFFDRNRVFLHWRNSEYVLSCETIAGLNPIIAAIVVAPDNKMLTCPSPMILSSAMAITRIRKRNTKTSFTYGIATWSEMAKKTEIKEFNEKSKIWSRELFINFSVGYKGISKSNQAVFDEETLIDFTNINTYWNFTTGYYLSDWLGITGNFGLIYSGKQKKVEDIVSNLDGSITISGSGQGGAIYKFGGGIRILPYKKNQLTTYIDLMIGQVKAIAGGGTATRTIFGSTTPNTSDITKKNEKTCSIDIILGANYRITKSFCFLGSFQYNISKFKEPIGSISGFSGLSFNLGMGVNFKL